MPLWVISPDLCITLSTYMLEMFVIFFKIKVLFTQEKTPVLVVTAFFFSLYFRSPGEEREAELSLKESPLDN